MAVIGTRTVTVVAALAALELLLRHVGGLGHWSASEQSERYGWRMLPDQDALSRELTIAERINHAGFRDREWDAPRPDPAATPQQLAEFHRTIGKPDDADDDSPAGYDAPGADEAPEARDARGGPAAPGTPGTPTVVPAEPLPAPFLKDESVFRVALVGNSMTFGTSVAIEDTWGRQLEEALAADFAARGVQRTPLVMNFAVQGYVFEQMARVYEDRIRPYRPDLLIVPMHPHDITPMKPAQDDPEYEFRTLILRSATYDWLNRHVINRWMPPPPAKPEALAAQRAVQAADDAITYAPFSKENQVHWLNMADRLDGVRRQLLADGGRLVIVSLPRWRSVFEPKLLGADTKWAPFAKARAGTLHIDPMQDFRPPMKALAEEIVGKGLPASQTFDLSTVTWTDPEGRQRPGTDLERAGDSLFLLYDNGHYTVAGHALLGEVIFRELSRGGVLP